MLRPLRSRARFAGAGLHPGLQIATPVTDLTADLQKGEVVAAGTAPHREGARGYIKERGGGLVVEKLRAGFDGGPHGAGFGGGSSVHDSHP